MYIYIYIYIFIYLPATDRFNCQLAVIYIHQNLTMILDLELAQGTSALPLASKLSKDYNRKQDHENNNSTKEENKQYDQLRCATLNLQSYIYI